MKRQYEYTPILGWSMSRYDKFLLCNRQYYYDYYGKYDDEYPRQKIDSLKKLTSIPLSIGIIVHDVIKTLLIRLLKEEKEIDKAKFIAFAKQSAIEYCQQNQFSEIYYHTQDKIIPDELFEKIQLSLTNFLNSDRYIWLTKKAISNKQDWIIEPEDFGETRINGMKAYCKVDFLFPTDNQIYVIDWKTGKQDEDKHRKQLLGYKLYASNNFSISPDEIIPIISYLHPEYKELELKFNESDIDDLTEQIKKETEIMYSMCEDIEENTPKSKNEFAKTTNKKICDWCNYRELCG